MTKETASKDGIPDDITTGDVLTALADLDAGVLHAFGQSTGYDVLWNGKRYPPKAVVGLAARRVAGHQLGPYDFKGGLQSKCFRVLGALGFDIVVKAGVPSFPDELDDEEHVEGAGTKVVVNRYERDATARAKCIAIYGSRCVVCGIDFGEAYGELGQGFIHVHHLTPLSEIGQAYRVDPKRDLRPVCPNCHAMIHRRVPALSVEAVKEKRKPKH